MSRNLAIVLIASTLMAPGIARATYIFDAFPKLGTFSNPIGVEDPMDGTDRLFIAERAGRIYVIRNDATVTSKTLFLDISALITTPRSCQFCRSVEVAR